MEWIQIPKAHHAIPIYGFQRETSISHAVANSTILQIVQVRERQKVYIFLKKESCRLLNKNKTHIPTKVTSLWSSSIIFGSLSMDQITRILQDSSSPNLDLRTSSTRRIVGLVKCCQSFSDGVEREVVVGQDREYLVSMYAAVVVVDRDMATILGA